MTGIERLTRRELTITQLVTLGLRNQDIYPLMGYRSEQMVKNALRGIFDKVGCDTRLQLALKYTAWKQQQQHRTAA